MAKKRLDLLLKEISDPYVQENFYKLKTYIENLTTGGSVGAQGTPGPAGPQGIPGAGGVLNLISGETLSALKFVYVGADGKVYLGNSASYDTSEVVGMTLQAVATGVSVQILPFGLAQDASFAYGYSQTLFLTTLGNVSTVAPSTGHRVKVGQGLDNGKIFVDIDETIIL